MAEKSTFFNSVSGDRKYKAEDMAAHFAKLITNGVYPAGTQLQATEDAGMSVTVSAGSAWINGYAYHNDGDFTLTFDAADGVLNRIDRIVVRWGRLARSINLAIVKGTPASSPTAPAVVRSADYYDLGIATVTINAGITAITQAMITDTRLDSDVCGFVSSLIQPDTSDWFTQFNSAFTTALNNNQSTWDTWFATLEDTLDENAAANLLNLINGLAGPGRTTETVKGNAAALLSHLADYTTQIPYAVTTGSANTYVVTTDPVLPALVAGVAITVKFHEVNTGASTLNWDTKGAKSIKNPDGTDVASGDLNGVFTLRYDGVNFILQGKGGVILTGDFVAGDLLAGKTGYSNDAKTKITGTMPNRGTFNLGLGASVPAGYYSGGTVPSGKRWASGNTTTESNGLLNISGLAFRPSYIIVEADYYGSYYRAVYLSDGTSLLNGYRYNDSSGTQALSTPFSISSNGFSVVLFAGISTCKWIAFE